MLVPFRARGADGVWRSRLVNFGALPARFPWAWQESARGQVEDLCFHLTMLATIAATRKNRPTAVDISEITEFPDTGELNELLKLVRAEFADGARRRREVMLDRVAKDGDVTIQLLNRAKTYLSSSPRRVAVA